MKMTCQIGKQAWVWDSEEVFDLSLPLSFDGEQPNAFSLPRASAQPFEIGAFVGDTRRGGSVNCFDVSLNPHGNGTHTECVGHILDQRVFVADVLKLPILPATLISVPLTQAGETGEVLRAPSLVDDLVISRGALEKTLGGVSDEFCQALIVRTLPNLTEKRSRRYSGMNPPYMTPAAMSFLVGLGVQHLLLDLPSVDREEDGGELCCHHLFWDVPQGLHSVDGSPSTKTITEMIFVPDGLEDGLYLLDLQIPHFCLDAAPSRPLVFPIKPVQEPPSP